jgi:hypothetical protein
MPVLGSTRASRVPTGALAGRVGVRVILDPHFHRTLNLFGEGAEHRTRGRVRSPKKQLARSSQRDCGAKRR